MSIIQEALRKAQGEYVEKKMPPVVKEEVVHPRPDNWSPQGIKKSTPAHLPIRKLGLPALVAVLTMSLLIYGIGLSLRYSRSHTKDVVVTKTAKTVSPPKAQPISLPKVETIDLMPSSPPTFVLNGIMYVEDKPQAIINGHVLEEGDKINGATVLVIEKDCVLLSINDANMKLELNK